MGWSNLVGHGQIHHKAPPPPNTKRIISYSLKNKDRRSTRTYSMTLHRYPKVVTLINQQRICVFPLLDVQTGVWYTIKRTFGRRRQAWWKSGKCYYMLMALYYYILGCALILGEAELSMNFTNLTYFRRQSVINIISALLCGDPNFLYVL